MGLDIVELVLATEDAFGIHISDEAFSEVTTAGDLCDLVSELVDGKQSRRCLTSMAFYRIRRGIVEVTGWEKRAVRPGSPLAEVFPQAGRRERWAALGRATGLKIPELQPPGWLTVSFSVTAMGIAVTVSIRSGVSAGWTAALALAGFIAGGGTAYALPLLSFAFPRDCAGVGDLARQVLALNQPVIVQHAKEYNERELWELVREVIATQMCIPRDRIHRESRLSQDLGID